MTGMNILRPLTAKWNFGPVGLASVCIFFVTLIIFPSCSKHPDVMVPKADTPRLVFSQTFGGSQGDNFVAVAKTSDGGYIMAGSTISANGSGDIPATPPVGSSYDMLIVKVGPDGSKQWVTTLGGDQDDYGQGIVACPDGSGYMIAGYTNSNNAGDIPATRGNNDIVVAKLSSDGKKQWVKTYGGDGDDIAQTLAVSPDGKDYILAGLTTSNNNGDIPPLHSKDFAFNSDIVVAKLRADGTLQWVKTYGGNQSESTRSIIVCPDGSGYALAGYTSSDSSGDIPKTHNGNSGISDMLVMKLGTGGEKQWARAYGGKDFDFATAIAASPDGSGYMITGMTISNNSGDIPATKGDYDIVVVKVDAGGNKQSIHTYGGNGDDEAFGIAATPDGDFVLAGFTGSNGSGDIPTSHAAALNYLDAVVARLGPDGSKKWVKAYGGNDTEEAISVVVGADGGLVIAGYTASNGDFNVPANHGRTGTNDGWLFKVKEGR